MERSRGNIIWREKIEKFPGEEILDLVDLDDLELSLKNLDLSAQDGLIAKA